MKLVLFLMLTAGHLFALQNFLFIGGNDPKAFEKKLSDNIDGVQIVYPWNALETDQGGTYTFERIEKDLSYLTSKKKKLWVQLQDRFFEPKDKAIPRYLQTNPIYDGGLAKQTDNAGENLTGSGWVAKQWNQNVRIRFQNLISALAEKFDGKIYGINLPETSADIDIKLESKTGFSCDNYLAATIQNINHAKSVFVKTYVVQYTNFWPCEWDNDHKYMSRFFENAVEKKIGLGGPDIVPYRKGQMKNSYPFFNKHKGKLAVVAFPVQEPTRTYLNPETKKRFTEAEFLDFGKNYLGVDVIFWSIQ